MNEMKGATMARKKTEQKTENKTGQKTGGKIAGRPEQPKQLLHLVFGGELTQLDGGEFRDLNALDIVGIYPNYQKAYAAWKSVAQKTVDNALMRYYIVHLHRLLEP